MKMGNTQWRSARMATGKEYSVLEADIEVSPNDPRQYRLVKLHNDLRALLISDPATDKAAAALGVQVGHLSDPDDLPGLAHFCEHMLFLGTERYPDEAEYKTYLSRNSGSSNAYTSLAETVYHFDVTPAGLPGALSRHAQFFTAPLFTPSCTEREVNAVDSEFRRNLQLDARRLFQLGKATSSREGGAAYWKFGTGSKETLWSEPRVKGEDVRQRLISWYHAHYSANLMNLVVLSSHTLDELTALVVSEYSDVPNTGRPRPPFPAPPITASEGSTEISYRTIKDVPQLRIEFGLPDLTHLADVKPGSFISHHIGHEGPGSILAELKRRGWATALSSSCSNGASGFDFFRININLTREGFQHYYEVVSMTFAYIDLLKRTPVRDWAFAETQQLGKIAWRWKENGQPRDTVRNLASHLCDDTYAPSRLLAGRYYATTYDPDAIKKVMDLLVLERGRVFVGSQAPRPGRDFWPLKEQYYGTEYELRPLTTSRKEIWEGLSLPEPNAFVPESLALLNDTPSPNPRISLALLRSELARRVLFKADDQWCIPRGSAYFLIRSPVADASPRDAMLTQVFTSLVEEALAPLSYDATLAGLHYSLGTEHGGILLAVSGYTEKLPLLALTVFDKMKTPAPTPEEFGLVLDRLTRAYTNAKLSNPSSLGDIELRRLTRQTFWTYNERLDALHTITLTDVVQHGRSLLERTQLDLLVHGNFGRTDAETFAQDVEEIILHDDADPNEIDLHRGLLLPRGSSFVYRPLVPSPENVNNAASLYYQVGSEDDDQLVARLSLFAQVAKVPVFSTLRTKEQLGYIVSSSIWIDSAVAGFRVVIQSERSPEYLDERTEALWATFGTYLEDMSAEEFEKERASLVASKLEKPKNLSQETSRYFEQIRIGAYDFEARTRRAGIIAGLSKADLKSFFEDFIAPTSSNRAKLAVLYRSQRFQPSTLSPLLEAVERLVPHKTSEAKELVDSKPTLEQVNAFVSGLDAAEQRDFQRVLSDLRATPPLPKGAEEIPSDDAAVNSFRKSLRRAERYRPRLDLQSTVEPSRL
ncbi:hypothetical protein JCM10908_001155 [Rhodotorula pacifica]|uniref:uncharacterized protein n=1 Tax=Rhodotorula pacifica TaxID=1495444 RepID=UPI00317373C1